MTSLTALVERFPMREFEIRRLCAQDPEFRSICEDHEAATTALRHWGQIERNAAREAEYRQIAEEIAEEVSARLDPA